jgi:hypothetical protein
MAGRDFSGTLRSLRLVAAEIGQVEVELEAGMNGARFSEERQQIVNELAGNCGYLEALLERAKELKAHADRFRSPRTHSRRLQIINGGRA